MTIASFPTRLGKYLLLERISTGGMAEVFLAKVGGAEGVERFVAIKRILPQHTSEERFGQMFIDEAKLAAQLAHANIVQTYELGRIGSQLYIAMELVRGQPLSRVMRRAVKERGGLPDVFCAYVIARAAEALDFAHRQTAPNGQPLDLVHRDVSPQNILVGYDGEVKLADFGIAKASERSTETVSGVIKGKLQYMAPEQANHSLIDRRTDVYALGIVLYELLAGRVLRPDGSVPELLALIREAKIPQLAPEHPDHAALFQPVLDRCLEPHRDLRYPYASEVAEALTPILVRGGTIFGARQASVFMHELFRADIEADAAKLREYAELRIEATQISPLERAENSAVFHTSLDGQVARSPTVAAVLAEPPSGYNARTEVAIALPPGSGDFPITSTDTKPADRGRAPEEDTPLGTAKAARFEDPSVVSRLHELVDRLSDAGLSWRPLVWPASAAFVVLAVGWLVVDFSASNEETPPPVAAAPEPPPRAPEPPPPAVPSPDEPVDLAPTAKPPSTQPVRLNSAPRVAAPIDGSKPPPRSSSPSKPAKSGFGWVSIGAKKGLVADGRVYVGGKFVGDAPVIGLKLSVGKHDVRIEGRNAAGAKVVLTDRVTVVAGTNESDPQRVVIE